MERQKFENEFKDAFEKAGLSPSDNLWTNIELEIEKTATEKMRRSLIMYKLMAAASFTLAMCIGGAYYVENRKLNSGQNLSYRASQNNEDHNANAYAVKSDTESDSQSSALAGPLATNSNQNSVFNKDEKVNDNTRRSVDASTTSQLRNISTEKNGAVRNRNSAMLVQVTRDDASQLTENSMSIASSEVAIDANQGAIAIDNQYPYEVASLQDRNITTLLLSPQAQLVLPQKQEVIDPVAVMMAKLEQREKELASEEDSEKQRPKSNREETLWTSVGFAAGTFNSNVHTSGSNVAASTANGFAASGTVSDNQNNAAGTAYSVGLSMGTRVSERWIIHGGVNYLTQNSSYQANGVVSSSDLRSFRAASISELKAASTNSYSDKYVPTAPYNINNNLQFISVPVQAGYMAVNRKVGLQLNAGISTDLFLQNTISPQSDGLEKSTQGRGSDSPYRPVNFSGLVGTELSYKLGTRYRLAVNPGLRYPMNSIYKSEVGVSSNPITMDIGVRFRYIFR